MVGVGGWRDKLPGGRPSFFVILIDNDNILGDEGSSFSRVNDSDCVGMLSRRSEGHGQRTNLISPGLLDSYVGVP